MSDEKTCGACGHCADRHGGRHRAADGVCLLMGVAVKKDLSETSTRPCGARYVDGKYVPVEWVDRNDPSIVDPIQTMNTANETIKKLASASVLTLDTLLGMMGTAKANKNEPELVNAHLSQAELFALQQRDNFAPLAEQ